MLRRVAVAKRISGRRAPQNALEFLDRNNALIKNGKKTISDGALVAITLMIAESDPKEKDIMTTMVMNLLDVG